MTNASPCFEILGATSVSLDDLVAELESIVGIPSIQTIVPTDESVVRLHFYVPTEFVGIFEEQAPRAIRNWRARLMDARTLVRFDVHVGPVPLISCVAAGDWDYLGVLDALAPYFEAAGIRPSVRVVALNDRRNFFFVIFGSDDSSPDPAVGISRTVDEHCANIGISRASFVLGVSCMRTLQLRQIAWSPDRVMAHLSTELAVGPKEAADNKSRPLVPVAAIVVDSLGRARPFEQRMPVAPGSADIALGLSPPKPGMAFCDLAVLRLPLRDYCDPGAAGIGAIRFADAVVHPLFAVWDSAKMEPFRLGPHAIGAAVAPYWHDLGYNADLPVDNVGRVLWEPEDPGGVPIVAIAATIATIHPSTGGAGELIMTDFEFTTGHGTGWPDVLRDGVRLLVVTDAEGEDRLSKNQAWDLRIARLAASGNRWFLTFEGVGLRSETRVYVLQRVDV